jgi:tetratricopeptide (TPR) repeat protein
MLWITKGYSSPEVIEATERAAQVAQKSGNLVGLVDLMVSKGVTAMNAGDMSAARPPADRALDLAERAAAPTSLGMAHALQLYDRVESGDYAGAEKHFNAGLKFFDDPGYRRHPGATTGAFFYGALNAWALGYADVARERLARMLAAADGNTLFEVAYSRNWAAALMVCLREYEQASAFAERAIELSEKYQFPLVAASARCVLGRARAELGHAAEGAELVRQGIAGMQKIGAFLGSSFVHLAVAQERVGAIAAALETVEESFRVYPTPDTRRLRGELRLKQGHLELAESDFRESIAVARTGGAKTLQLCATMRLARLLDSQGKRDEAHAMLAEIYNWFTEGFDTADLKDAKALLEALNG